VRSERFIVLSPAFFSFRFCLVAVDFFDDAQDRVMCVKDCETSNEMSVSGSDEAALSSKEGASRVKTA